MYCCACKKYKFPIFCLYNKLYCTNHSTLLYNKSIVLIQKIYRGYKKRKCLNNIFKRLPRDLQIHILEFNTIKHKKNICITNLIDKTSYKIKSFSNITSNKITLKELNHILVILLKYKCYLDYKWKNYFNYYFNNICNILLLIISFEYFPNNINYIPSQISSKIYNSIDFMPNLIKNDFFYQVNLLLDNTYVFLKK